MDRARIHSVTSWITSFVIFVHDFQSLVLRLGQLDKFFAFRNVDAHIVTTHEKRTSEPRNLDRLHQLFDPRGSGPRAHHHVQERRRHDGFLEERIGASGVRPARISNGVTKGRLQIRARHCELWNESASKT